MSPESFVNKIYKAVSINAIFISFISGFGLKIFYGQTFNLILYLVIVLGIGYNLMALLFIIYVSLILTVPSELVIIPDSIFILSNILISIFVFCFKQYFEWKNKNKAI